MVRLVDRLNFTSKARSERLATWVGLWLGIAFGVCFVTGLISHAIQQPPWWFVWPSRPVNLYRVTQGLHVATGLACIPLVSIKVWSVYPHLFAWPPVRDLNHLVSRISVLVLTGSVLFQLVTGVLNIARWYAFDFYFPTAHYWTAWIAIGAILVHIGSKIVEIRRGLARDKAADPKARLTRRQMLGMAGAAAGAITVATVGQTVAPLAPLSVLAPRRPDVGSQGLPVNKSAVSAGVVTTARDPEYRLRIANGARTVSLSLTDLNSLPQHSVHLPIACVEGWSASADWTGVRVMDLLALVGAGPDTDVRVESLQRSGNFRASTLPPPHLEDPLTLLALRINGKVLDLDHGYPCRIIAPNRPGVLQTKWVASLRVLT